MSAANPTKKFEDDAALGLFLSEAGHADILSAAFGTVPSGLRTCLARGGDRQHSRRHYQYLAALLAHPERDSIRTIVRRLDPVTPEKLPIVRALPHPLRDARLVSTLRSVDDARDLARFFRLLVGAGVQEVALKQSLSMIRTMADGVLSPKHRRR